jgi:RNA polymerase sigma factor (sigma-70 family)
MPTAPSEPVARFIRWIAEEAAVGLSDAQLLARFAAERDEAAFAALVRRHGTHVLSVCRRALRDTHAADDAFQATFLLLACKAGSLTHPERLASWLHGVACRMATRARAEQIRRRVHESRVAFREAAGPDDSLDWRDVRAILDEEVNRLPTRQRDFEGG